MLFFVCMSVRQTVSKAIEEIQMKYTANFFCEDFLYQWAFKFLGIVPFVAKPLKGRFVVFSQ